MLLMRELNISFGTNLDFHFIDYKATPVILLSQIFFLGRLQTPLENFIVPARFFFNFVLVKPMKIVNRALFCELCYKSLHAFIFDLRSVVVQQQYCTRKARLPDSAVAWENNKLPQRIKDVRVFTVEIYAQSDNPAK